MKIAILINTLHNGYGMANVAIQQALELINENHNVDVFTFESSVLMPNIGIFKLNWPKKGLINYIYRLLYVVNIPKNFFYSLKLKNYDVMIAHFYPMNYLAHFAKKRYPHIKYIYYDHGVGKSDYNNISRKCYGEFIRRLTSLSISNADYIISVSNYLGKLSSMSNIPTKVIYNKVDANRLQYNLSAVSTKITNFCDINGPNKTPIFLYVGILTRYKGIHLLIESFKKTLRTLPSAKLILVGKISEDINLSNYLKDISPNNVFYAGRVSDNDLGFLYNICDVYTSASTWEGFNLPLVEAQLIGKPVVAFDIGAHGEVIKDKKTGILVKPFDTSEFADAIVLAYNNKQCMGEKAKEWAFKFSVHNKNSETISRFIEELCDNEDSDLFQYVSNTS